MAIVRLFPVGKYIGIVYQLDDESQLHSRHHNGYVVLPKGHPCEGKGYDDIKMDVHGGLTFGERINKKEAHWLPDDLAEEADGRWMYGFDCAHVMDATDPDGTFLGMKQKGLHYWTADEVEAEVRNMIKQFQRKRPSRRKA